MSQGEGALMDVPRSRARPRTRRIVLVVAALGALVATTSGIRWLRSRAPSVSRAQLWIGTVQRGPLSLEVRGQGTLVPVDVRWASAPVAARVERVLVQPGAPVAADTVILELANPDAELAALSAERDVAAAEAALAQLAAQLDGARLAQESAVAGLAADTAMATRRKDVDSAMATKGVISDLEGAESADRSAQLAKRLEFEKRRLGALRTGNTAQLAAQQAQVEGLRALAVFRRKQLDALRVRAGQVGVVQLVAVEAGQSVPAGAPLAKVVVPDHLQARVMIPEASTEDVGLGLHATIDTRSGVVDGEVIRIDPAAKNGSVTVDVRLTGELPRSARPDQNVEATIQLARTGDVLHVARPAIGEARATVSVWRIAGDEVHRVRVTFGRAALKDIEIASGLSAGDQIVLSDMSRWDGEDRLRLE